MNESFVFNHPIIFWKSISIIPWITLLYVNVSPVIGPNFQSKLSTEGKWSFRMCLAYLGNVHPQPRHVDANAPTSGINLYNVNHSLPVQVPLTWLSFVVWMKPSFTAKSIMQFDLRREFLLFPISFNEHTNFYFNFCEMYFAKRNLIVDVVSSIQFN